jgi:hypothetical protein
VPRATPHETKYSWRVICWIGLQGDVDHIDSYAEFDIDGKKCKCALVPFYRMLKPRCEYIGSGILVVVLEHVFRDKLACLFDGIALDAILHKENIFFGFSNSTVGLGSVVFSFIINSVLVKQSIN